jgi:hypothetical protein
MSGETDRVFRSQWHGLGGTTEHFVTTSTVLNHRLTGNYLSMRLWRLLGGIVGLAGCAGGDDPYRNEQAETAAPLAQAVCGPNGQGNTCDPSCPCASGWGDCDGNADCAPGLVCGTDNGRAFGMPALFDVCVADSCGNGVQDPGEEGVDCGGSCQASCVVCPANDLGNTCSAQCRCAEGWGDCDSDAECLPDHVCLADQGFRFGIRGDFDVCVPRCEDGRQDGDETGVDCGGSCAPCPPPNTTRKLALGWSNTCVLEPDGRAWCWGGNGSGESTLPAETFLQLAPFPGGCGVREDRSVACWTRGDMPPAGADGGAFTQVSTALGRSCALRTDGKLTCWNGATVSFPLPSETFAQVSVGREICGIRGDGTLACSESVPPAGTFAQVAATHRTTNSGGCAIRTDGTMACWAFAPLALAGTFKRVALAEFAACALRTDGTLACFGVNPGHPIRTNIPGGTFTEVAVSENHACAVTTDGQIQCWGSDQRGKASVPGGTFTQIAEGECTCRLRPDATLSCWGTCLALPPPSTTFQRITVGSSFTAFTFGCGIRPDGTLLCWGDNVLGRATPPAGTFIDVDAGDYHACAVRTDGTLACWGSNDERQATPPAGTFTSVSSATWHSCALRTDGLVACWGRPPAAFPSSDFGQARSVPGTFTAIATSMFHSCGIRSNGSIFCWGRSDLTTPPAGSFTKLFIDHGTTCGIRADGTLACSGTTPPSGTFSSGSGTCALRTDGTETCWGGVLR